jgi:hypothetical protein
MNFLSRIISPVVIFIISIQFIFAIPEAFFFNSSMLQAFYFFESVTIDGQVVDADDWLGAFNGDVCVGARRWGNCFNAEGIGQPCDLPVLGDDGTEFTTGYMMPGGIPSFKIFDASESEYLDAVASEDIPWFYGQYFMLDNLQNAVSG